MLHTDEFFLSFMGEELVGVFPGKINVGLSLHITALFECFAKISR